MEITMEFDPRYVLEVFKSINKKELNAENLDKFNDAVSFWPRQNGVSIYLFQIPQIGSVIFNDPEEEKGHWIFNFLEIAGSWDVIVTSHIYSTSPDDEDLEVPSILVWPINHETMEKLNGEDVSDIVYRKDERTGLNLLINRRDATAYNKDE